MTITVFQRVPLSEDDLPEGEVSVQDAARYLKVSDETIRRWCAEKRIDAVKAPGARGRQGWRWLIPASELRRLRSPIPA